jgi:hypothetical protein
MPVADRGCVAAGLVALAFARSAFPQDLPATDVSVRQTRIFAQIEQAQAQGGENSSALIQPLTDLGLLLEEQGDLTLAAGAFERARAVMRVNYGFSTLDEALLLQHLVRVEEARDNAAVAWNLEQEALALAEQQRGDVRAAQIFAEVADKRMHVLRLYRDGEFPPQIALGCYYQKIGSIYQMLPYDAGLQATPLRETGCGQGDRAVATLALLMEARAYDAAALDVVLQNDGYAGDSLGAHLRSVLRKTEQLRQFVPEYPDPFINDLLGQLLAHEPEDALSLRRHAEILVQAADLGVLRAHSARRPGELAAPLEQYRQALRELVEAGAGPAAIEAIFEPQTPIVLSTFKANPLAAADASNAVGYIDVAFEITSHGRGEQIRIIDATADVPRSARKQLIRVIETSSFRPRVSNGEIADTSPVVVRYYVPGPQP